MIKILTITFLFSLISSAHADSSSFVGEWKISLAPGTEAIRVQEIRYPRWLRISRVKGSFIVEYRDQFDTSCKLDRVLVINNDTDLIFPSCGTTKHPTSYTPIHHVKVLNGKLRGVVSTSEKLFEWVGKRITDKK